MCLGALLLSCGRAGDAAPTSAVSYAPEEEPPAVASASAGEADPGEPSKAESLRVDDFESALDQGIVDAPPPPPKAAEPPADDRFAGNLSERRVARGPSASPMPPPAPNKPAVATTLALPQGATGRFDGLSGDGAGGAEVGRLRGRPGVVDAEGEELEDGDLDDVSKTVNQPLARLTTRADIDGKDEKKRDQAEKRKKGAREEGRKAEEQDQRGQGLEGGKLDLDLERLPSPDALTYVHPERMLPRMFYFENTYLGGSAAYRERLLRLDAALREGERPYRLAYGARQPFDAPTTSGLEVTAQLDTPYLDQPRRVFLQVGLRGSPRYGWRRPPLDVMLVIDGPALSQAPEAVMDMVVEVLAKLGPADRLGVVVADGEPRVFTELARLDRARGRLAATLDTLPAAAPRRYDANALGHAMAKAGEILAAASADTAIVPGTETVLVVTAGNDAGRVASATASAHALTLQGAVTSVFALDRAPERGGWWQVANAGHGNYHHLGDATTGELVTWELESLARVVARLVRVNIRLGKTAGAIRVLGTRVLDEEEVARVKAREEATDKNLSRSMGITSDRGEDDDGIQTVIPYFYGDDSHVILVELWVDGPGPIADVTVKYKDMVNLGNATARTSVRVDSLPRPETPESDMIAKNVAGFELAEALQRASHRVKHGDPAGAAAQLSIARDKAALTDDRDHRVLDGFEALVNSDQRWTWDANRRAAVSASLELAGERRVGESAP
ncbi:MAG: hypothetical protein CVU56_24045 [Deltaproteobacteria bacterium HGW-Deltaproteobacteria-14]|nr:MAG: hypothetical protein CVU56_24045 [Deltaproteobacteria bacterium HGW-Deltaproteobacteria-14]